MDIYPDDATERDMIEAGIAFLEEQGYLECSSWGIVKNEKGEFVIACCMQHKPKIYPTAREAILSLNVYPDQDQDYYDEDLGDYL